MTHDSSIEAMRERAEVFPGVAEDSHLQEFFYLIRNWNGVDDLPDMPPDTNLWRWYDDAARDRATLLAEVDRLTNAGFVQAALDEGAMRERARIRAVVEALPVCPDADEEGERWWLDRAAVIAAIERETHREHPDHLMLGEQPWSTK